MESKSESPEVAELRAKVAELECREKYQTARIAILAEKHAATGEEIDERIHELNQQEEQNKVWRDGQIEGLNEMLDTVNASCRLLEKRLTDAEAKLADLERTFPCGHRIIDWDDSYGGCLACGLKVAAVECETERHDERIADAEAKVRLLLERVGSIGREAATNDDAPLDLALLALGTISAMCESILNPDFAKEIGVEPFTPEPVNHPEPERIRKSPRFE